jgi:hypothetical protein
MMIPVKWRSLVVADLSGNVPHSVLVSRIWLNVQNEEIRTRRRMNDFDDVVGG